MIHGGHAPTWLFLADAVDAAEALLQAVQVPRDVVIEHEIAVLKVHALPGGIGGEENVDLGIGTEQGLTIAICQSGLGGFRVRFATRSASRAPRQPKDPS